MLLPTYIFVLEQHQNLKFAFKAWIKKKIGIGLTPTTHAPRQEDKFEALYTHCQCSEWKAFYFKMSTCKKNIYLSIFFIIHVNPWPTHIYKTRETCDAYNYTTPAYLTRDISSCCAAACQRPLSADWWVVAVARYHRHTQRHLVAAAALNTWTFLQREVWSP